MTKARDIASAIPAPSTVSSAELGYLDGVTSAIQTQVDAKIAKTLTTTTGDIIYASAANTPARLGIGSTDQILKVTGGIPAWATPTAAASGLTLIAEQSYSATQTINVDNVFSATYDNYKIFNRATISGGNSFTMKMRVGGTDTSANYASQLTYGDNTSTSSGRNVLGTDEWFFGDAESSGMTTMDIMSPYLSAETQALALAGYRTTGLSGLVRMISMELGDTTSYTGFTLLCGANATGKVSIYGYAK
jgi:hypothetical protein